MRQVWRTHSRQISLFLLILPVVAFLLVAYAYPLLRVLRLSLFDPELTLRHYVGLLTSSPGRMQVLWNTLTLSLSVAFYCLLLGYPVAYLLAKGRSRASRIVLMPPR